MFLVLVVIDGGEEGVRVVLEELDRRGAEMGVYEADGGKLEVHDGVRVGAYFKESADFCPVSA